MAGSPGGEATGSPTVLGGPAKEFGLSSRPVWALLGRGWEDLEAGWEVLGTGWEDLEAGWEWLGRGWEDLAEAGAREVTGVRPRLLW